MEATQAEEKRSPVPKIGGRVCNEYLLCRKLPPREKVGSLYLRTEDNTVNVSDAIEKRAQVVLVSPKLIAYMDDFEVGDIFIYPNRTKEMDIWIEDQQYFLLHKKDVVYVEPKE